MADTVRYLMEEMIPELEELEKKGYFSRSEIRQIVQKRQDFEYALKRRATLKKDFLRYIEYESKLEELRKHRKRANGIKGKKGPAETGIVRRIHFIYERATRKFKADLSLWMAWLAFCKKAKSTKQHSKVVTKALHRHSHVAALWIEAAAWEFERNANVAAARALMQQGLRHCRTDEALWAEYVRLELMYVARLRARRAVLGLTNPESAEDIARLHEQDVVKPGKKRKAPEAATVAGQEGEEQQQAAAGGKEEDASEAAARAVLTGKVARLAFKGACKAVPNSLGLRRRVLRVLRQFKFPGVAELTAHVYDTIAADFPASEEAWDLRARQYCADEAQALQPPPASQTADSSTDASTGSAGGAGGEGEQAAGAAEGGAWWERDCAEAEAGAASASGRQFDESAHQRSCEVYKAALRALPTPRMHALYARFLGQQVGPQLAAAAAGDMHAVERAASLGAELLALLQSAHDSGHASEALCVQWVAWGLRLDQPKLALKAARLGCARWPASAPVWARRLQLELELCARKQHKASDLFQTFKQALLAVPAAQGSALWSLALRSLEPGGKDFKQLVDLLVQALASGPRGPVHGGMGAVAGELLRCVHGAQGLEAARVVCDRLLAVPAPGGDFFRAALALEGAHLEDLKSQPSSTSSTSAQRKAAESRVRKLFEAAVDAYGSLDDSLWLQYALFERGALRGAGDIYWRATKALADPDAFVAKYREALGTA